jgi:hypothetical protein
VEKDAISLSGRTLDACVASCPRRRPPTSWEGGGGGRCRCLNLSTSIGGTRSKVEGGDRHDLESEGMREDTRHKIYTGSSSRSSYPMSCLE